jgi:hypothetical protein
MGKRSVFHALRRWNKSVDATGRAEKGSNPRETDKKTENKRGMTLKDCIRVFQEAKWKVLEGAWKFYSI